MLVGLTEDGDEDDDDGGDGVCAGHDVGKRYKF